MDIDLLVALLSWAVMVGTCGYAGLRGGRPERFGALINVVGCLVTFIVRLFVVSAWLPAALSILAIDIAVAAGFFWLATTTTRFWPIWASGFALSNLLMSVAGALLPRTELFVYHTGLGIYAYLALGALALGTYRLPRNASPALRNGSRVQCQETHTPKT